MSTEVQSDVDGSEQDVEFRVAGVTSDNKAMKFDRHAKGRIVIQYNASGETDENGDLVSEAERGVGTSNGRMYLHLSKNVGEKAIRKGVLAMAKNRCTELGECPEIGDNGFPELGDLDPAGELYQRALDAVHEKLAQELEQHKECVDNDSVKDKLQQWADKLKPTVESNQDTGNRDTGF